MPKKTGKTTGMGMEQDEPNEPFSSFLQKGILLLARFMFKVMKSMNIATYVQ